MSYHTPKAIRLAVETGSEAAVVGSLLFDGDSIANIKLVEDPAKNFVVIMKDGKVYKNTVSR